MAELEVAKATKSIIDTSVSKEYGLWMKIKKITSEIIIIIFAVSISIAFHAWSEDRREQKEVKEFLIGLKTDLEKDIKELEGDMAAYTKQKHFFSYVANIPAKSLASQDSINANKSNLFNFTGFKGNEGRYQGFKSSGKIGFIENDAIQNAILDLYEEDIPLLVTSTDFYKGQKLKYADYIFDHSVDFPKGNFLQVISSEPIKNRSKIYLSGVDQIINNYQACIWQMQNVISLIDKEYKD